MSLRFNHWNNYPERAGGFPSRLALEGWWVHRGWHKVSRNSSIYGVTLGAQESAWLMHLIPSAPPVTHSTKSHRPLSASCIDQILVGGPDRPAGRVDSEVSFAAIEPSEACLHSWVLLLDGTYFRSFVAVIAQFLQLFSPFYMEIPRALSIP